MSEEAKKNLETISDKLKDIPQDVASAALEQYAARMEGFADGFEEMLQLFLDDSLDELTYTKENDQWQHNFY